MILCPLHSEVLKKLIAAYDDGMVSLDFPPSVTRHRMTVAVLKNGNIHGVTFTAEGTVRIYKRYESVPCANFNNAEDFNEWFLEILELQ